MYSFSKDREKIEEILAKKRANQRKEEEQLEQKFRDLLNEARETLIKMYKL